MKKEFKIAFMIFILISFISFMFWINYIDTTIKSTEKLEVTIVFNGEETKQKMDINFSAAGLVLKLNYDKEYDFIYFYRNTKYYIIEEKNK